MTYQIIYSSNATKPMQSVDLEEILEGARRSNGAQGITGALIYADGVFLQILEGDRDKLADLMVRIREDARHDAVAVLREGEMPAAVFSGWKMAYVAATPEQVARWAGLSVQDAAEDPQRTAQFAQDILSLLTPDKSHAPAPAQDIGAGPGAG